MLKTPYVFLLKIYVSLRVCDGIAAFSHQSGKRGARVGGCVCVCVCGGGSYILGLGFDEVTVVTLVCNTICTWSRLRLSALSCIIPYICCFT